MLKRRQIMTWEQEPGIKNSCRRILKLFTSSCQGTRQMQTNETHWALPAWAKTETSHSHCWGETCIAVPVSPEMSGSEGDGGADRAVNCLVSLNELCKLTTLRKAARCMSCGVGTWWPGAAPSLPTCCAVRAAEMGEHLVGGTPSPFFFGPVFTN